MTTSPLPFAVFYTIVDVGCIQHEMMRTYQISLPTGAPVSRGLCRFLMVMPPNNLSSLYALRRTGSMTIRPCCSRTSLPQLDMRSGHDGRRYAHCGAVAPFFYDDFHDVLFSTTARSARSIHPCQNLGYRFTHRGWSRADGDAQFAQHRDFFCGTLARR